MQLEHRGRMLMYVHTPGGAADILNEMVNGDRYGIAVLPTLEISVFAVQTDHRRLLFGGVDAGDGPTLAAEPEPDWKRDTSADTAAASLGRRQ